MTKRKRFDAVARTSAIAVFEDELKTRSDGYMEHLAHGGKADCGEEFYLDALYMAIAALREQESAKNAHCNSCKKRNSWISVAERLPKRGETVLCYMNFERDGSDLTWKNTITENRYDGVLVGSNPKKHVWEWQGDFVTHWMPLPEPPEEVEV